MKDIVRQTRSHLELLFEKHGYSPRHNLGQNFLIDLNLIDYIVISGDVGPEDVVLEIGAGTGSLSSYLAVRAGHVISVEIDPRMYALAQETTAGLNNVTLLNCDALRTKNTFEPKVLKAIHEQLAVSPDRKLKLIANLPYCVATPVISNLVAGDIPWAAMVVTIQWELGERMQAQPGSELYGALAVWLQAHAKVKVLKKLGPTVFWPRPKVDSAIVRLQWDPKLVGMIGNRAFFHDFVRRTFAHRRKFLRSVLCGMYSQQLSKSEVDAILEPLKLPEGVRAEALEIKRLIEISNACQRALEDKNLLETVMKKYRSPTAIPAEDEAADLEEETDQGKEEAES